MSAEKIQLPADWTEIDSLKMCYSARYDIKQLVKQTKDHITWRTDPTMHNIDPTSKALLESGFVYLVGRDREMRPVIVLDCLKIDLKKQGEANVIRALCVL